VPRGLRVLLGLALLIGVVWAFVLPKLPDAAASVAALHRISPPLVVLAFLLEAASVLSFSGLTAVIVGPGRIRYRMLVCIDLADLAVNHTLPGGGPASAAARFRLLEREGLPGHEAVAAATVEAGLANLVLMVVFCSGVALTVVRVHGDATTYLTAVGVVLALLGVIAGGRWAALRMRERAVYLARRVARRMPLLGEERLVGLARSLSDGVRALAANPRFRIGHAIAFALGNWLFDAASLWVSSPPSATRSGSGRCWPCTGSAALSRSFRSRQVASASSRAWWCRR
jgi:uncharacterized membrane protein YbhN (UPF0104 family)